MPFYNKLIIILLIYCIFVNTQIMNYVYLTKLKYFNVISSMNAGTMMIINYL